MPKWFRRVPPGDNQQAWDARADRISANEARDHALAEHAEVVRELEALLFDFDPIGINLVENTDEYRPEAETITLRLAEAATVDDVRRIVHEEFVRWFDENLAGPEDRYGAIAGDIWELWSRDPK
jgi:hypothetical protein